MLAFWSAIPASIFFIWIFNCITTTIAISTGRTTVDPSSSLFYAIVTTNDTVDNDGNITTTTTTSTTTAAKQLANKFNQNVNLTSSASMMNLFELMMPQYLMMSNSPPGIDPPDPHFHHHHPHHNHHHGHGHHHHHHHHGHHGQPDFAGFAPALMDPEPGISGSPGNPEVQLIIDYYHQLYGNDQPRTFPFTTPALDHQFTPTVSYSLDEFSSLMPNYQPIFTTNETPCSLEKSADDYAKTKTNKRPTTTFKSTDDDQTDCSGGDGRNENDNDDDDEENSDDNGGGGGRDDDDTPLPYDPFEYLNQYRKAIPNGGQSNHNDGEADSKPDDGGGGAEEEETNNNNQDNDQQPSKSTDGEENGDGDGGSGGGGDNKEVDDDKTGSGTSDNNNDNNSSNTGEEPESEPEPETNDSKTESNLIELDTKTARKNEPNDWEPKDDDDFDQDESSSRPITMAKALNTTVAEVVSERNERENRTRIRSKRSLSTVIDQLRMVNDQFNQIDAMDPIYDMHPSSSRSMLPNLMPYMARPRPTSPLSMSAAANLLGSPNYFDYWNQASIQNSRANAHWKHHLRHHPGQGLRFSNQPPHRNNHYPSKQKSVFLKNQAYPYQKLRQKFYYPAGNAMTSGRPVPTVYSELDEIHQQQKAIHDSFRSGGELLLPRGYEDPDNFQPPQEQFQYPPMSPMSPEYVENENPDAPIEEEEYGNEDEPHHIPQRPQPLPEPEPNYYDENMSFDGQVVVGTNPNEDYPPPDPQSMMIRTKPPYAYRPPNNNGYFNARLPVFPRKSHKNYKLMHTNHQLYGF